MATTTSAQQNQQICPLCGESLAQDENDNGFVRHLAVPRGPTIFDDTAKIQAMLSAGDLAPGFREYFEKTGRCPFQRGQKD